MQLISHIYSSNGLSIPVYKPIRPLPVQETNACIVLSTIYNMVQAKTGNPCVVQNIIIHSSEQRLLRRWMSGVNTNLIHEFIVGSLKKSIAN